MILRKPYAFFIKYFKLLHAIIVGIIVFLLYRSFSVYNFFRTYVGDYTTALTNMSPRAMLNMYSFVFSLLVIILIIVLLSVMIYKKKPKGLYIYSIIVYIALIALFFFTYPILRDINSYLIDVRLSSALRDFYLIVCVLQFVCLILYSVRAAGFDIKQFDFRTDLQQLDIDEKDSEEIELSLEFDGNKVHRNVRYQLRNFKYFYKEHKFIFNTCVIIFVLAVGFNIYMSIMLYKVNYGQGTSFSASGVMMNVQDSYLTQFNPQGKKLTDDTIVVVKMDLKRQGSTEVLNTGLTTLIVDGVSYGQNRDYAKELYDIGDAYVGQTLNDEFQRYILAFVVPKDDANKKMQLKFNDNISYVRGEMGAKNVFIDLKPVDLDAEGKAYDSKIGDELKFNDSVLEASTFKIKGYEFNTKFKIGYKYCYATDKCIDSYEYLTPSATGNYYKTLMRINGYFVPDSVNNSEISSITSLLNNFAIINYKLNNIWYSQRINTQIIKPKVGTDNTNYYIEVPLDVMNASEIYLSFKIRNLTYKYVLKQ